MFRDKASKIIVKRKKTLLFAKNKADTFITANQTDIRLMEIRKATDNDFIEILYLAKAYAELVPAVGTLNWTANPISEMQLKEAIHLGDLFIVTENLSLGILLLNNELPTNEGINTSIINLIIHPVGEKKGCASLLLKFAIQKAEDIGALSLTIKVPFTHSRCTAALEQLEFQTNTPITDLSSVLLFKKNLA